MLSEKEVASVASPEELSLQHHLHIFLGAESAQTLGMRQQVGSHGKQKAQDYIPHDI